MATFFACMISKFPLYVLLLAPSFVSDSRKLYSPFSLFPLFLILFYWLINTIMPLSSNLISHALHSYPLPFSPLYSLNNFIYFHPSLSLPSADPKISTFQIWQFYCATDLHFYFYVEYFLNFLSFNIFIHELNLPLTHTHLLPFT